MEHREGGAFDAASRAKSEEQVLSRLWLGLGELASVKARDLRYQRAADELGIDVDALRMKLGEWRRKRDHKAS